ncbi:SDR family oxidoreductase [Croceicoccus sp. BE223]|uniref:SDR family NAD(P)-dependent oxidoreductase n=1 Tax=Croceicoccus sp. BE223 TaxID=2817716 RepID=UPI002866E0CD|nr:SDR family oxidoreductase [Croceicoccus sp. BE223]MDR7101663.1 NAD(P)-dependent dehydrogenase (short-subunit alcohol dehydrogenase family) [Croceicoccus sp. BE223]
MSTLTGKTILVNGCTSGIGAATFRLAAGLGAEVIGTGRRREEGEALAHETGGTFVCLDLTDDPALKNMFDRLRDGGVTLHGAVNNAAMTQAALPINAIDGELFDRLMAINLRATFRCLQLEMTAMRGQGGSIVNVASIAGKRGFKGLAAYTASKHAVIGLTRSAALDGAADNVRVNAVLPGTTRTGMFDEQMRTRPGGEAATVAAIPLGRTARPEEIAQAIVWLLSDASGFVTGECITADGGRTVT